MLNLRFSDSNEVEKIRKESIGTPRCTYVHVRLLEYVSDVRLFKCIEAYDLNRFSI